MCTNMRPGRNKTGRANNTKIPPIFRTVHIDTGEKRRLRHACCHGVHVVDAGQGARGAACARGVGGPGAVRRDRMRVCQVPGAARGGAGGREGERAVHAARLAEQPRAWWQCPRALQGSGVESGGEVALDWEAAPAGIGKRREKRRDSHII